MFLAFPTNPTEAIFFVVVLLLSMVALLPFWMMVYEEVSGKSDYSNQCHWPVPRCKGQCRHANSRSGACPRFKEIQK